MNLEFFNEKINSMILLILTVIASLFFFTISKISNYFPVLITLLMIFNYQGLKALQIFKIVVSACLFSFFCAYFIVFFPSKEMMQPPYYDLKVLKISHLLFFTQFKIFIKVAMLSSISFASIKIINFEKVLIHLMRKKIVTVTFGYPILLAFNSISLIKSEFEKIKVNAKLRGLNLKAQMNVFFPLLVFAIRHADRGAMSLISRGLNENKSFYFDTSPRKNDYFILLGFIIVVFICCLV